MTDEPEIEVEADDSLPEEQMHGPDGSLDCINGRYDFIAYWLEKLGVEDPRGAAITFGQECSLTILHPHTGKWMTPEEIVKAAGRVAPVTRIQ